MNYKEEIKELRIRMEKVINSLKEFEINGDKNSGECALWEVYYAWNGKEYSNLEKKLKNDK